MSEVSLQHGMTRQMAVSQSMQTGMQILQASALELRQIIRQALETNPMLEELPDASPEALEDGPDGDAWNEREDGWNEFTAEGRLSGDAAARRDFMYESVVAPESLKTHLMDQAQHSALTGRARDALFLLIDALDERGFLTESPQELEEQGCFSMRDMEEALAALREMDPPGVGAADLRDSLLIQLIVLVQNGYTAVLAVIRAVALAHNVFNVQTQFYFFCRRLDVGFEFVVVVSHL